MLPGRPNVDNFANLYRTLEHHEIFMFKRFCQKDMFRGAIIISTHQKYLVTMIKKYLVTMIKK